MIPLFDFEQLHNFKSSEQLQFICEYCSVQFAVQCRFVKSYYKRGLTLPRFCSTKCHSIAQRTRYSGSCRQCDAPIIIIPKEAKKSKSGNSFCSRSCAATYNNTHKTTGTRRSKLECWLEVELTRLLPQYEFVFNSKDTINSELDIYIPALKLAFELNGIFHYEPIYGSDKLASIQNNDNRKFQACLEKQISLAVIDVSSLSYFKPANAQKYLDIILSIIDKHSRAYQT